jgi:hypothetical protein
MRLAGLVTILLSRDGNGLTSGGELSHVWNVEDVLWRSTY